MKIDFDQVLMDPDGNPMPREEPKAGDPATTVAPLVLKDPVCRALMAPLEGDQADPNATYNRFGLFQKIYPGGVVEIDAGDVEMIKHRVGRVFGAWVMGLTWDMLEGRDKPLDLSQSRDTPKAAPVAAPNRMDRRRA